MMRGAIVALALIASSIALGCSSDSESEPGSGGAAGAAGTAGAGGTAGGCSNDCACIALGNCCVNFDASCPGSGGSAGAPVATELDLRADSDRDGDIELFGSSDDSLEDSQSALFLANIDDDAQSCPKGAAVSDEDMAKCQDAANTEIDGPEDLRDLASIQLLPWPSAPVGVGAKLEIIPAQVADRVRLFKGNAASFSTIASNAALSHADVTAGVELRIEGRDILRDATWDGTLTLRVSLETDPQQSDSVKLRMAPVVLHHHAQRATEIYTTPFASKASTDFRADVNKACAAAVTKYTELPDGLGDQWTQDYFETAYMSMPRPGGGQHVIRVYLRSPNFKAGKLRTAGRVVYDFFHGRDRAGVTHYDPAHPDSADTLNSLGNVEAIPPHSFAGQNFPLGRLLIGSTADFSPDKSLIELLSAQASQPIVEIDTSWLSVAHVDETVSFVRAKSPRGWVMLVNDPKLARTMLEQAQSQGHGSAVLFSGKLWWDNTPFTATVDQVLADSGVMAQSAVADVEIADQLSVIKAATGVTDADIVRVPFLHYKNNGLSAAYQPGTVNGHAVGDKVFAAPDPHGPVINGKDIFKQQLETALAPFGVSVAWVEDWDLYHRLGGEVHCGTNHDREVTAAWWEGVP